MTVLHDSDNGVSSRKALPGERAAAAEARTEFIGEAPTAAEAALRSRVSITTTTRDAYARAERNLGARVRGAGATTLNAVGGVQMIEQAVMLTRDLRASQQHIEFKGPQFLEDAGGQYVLTRKKASSRRSPQDLH